MERDGVITLVEKFCSFCLYVYAYVYIYTFNIAVPVAAKPVY